MSASSCRCGSDAPRAAPLRIRELSAEGWRNLAAAHAATGRTALGPLRRQRAGQDQRSRGRVLPGGPPLVPHHPLGRPASPRPSRAGERGWPRSSFTAGSSAGSRSTSGLRDERCAWMASRCVAWPRRCGTVSVVLFVPEDLFLFAGRSGRAAQVPRPGGIRRRAGLSGRGGSFPEGAEESKRPVASGLGRSAFARNLRRGAGANGARVVVRRRALVADLGPRLAEQFRALHGDLPVTMRYESAGGGQRRRRVGGAWRR